MAHLSRELRSWAAEPIDTQDLLAHLEKYEETGRVSEATRVAEQIRGLNWSSQPELQQLAQEMEDNYRAARFRQRGVWGEAFALAA